MRALVVLAVTSAALASATSARASFRWDATDPSCPSAAEVEAAIARAGAGGGSGPGAVALEARASAHRVEGGYELHLETRDASGVLGERDLQGDTCAQVADAAALVLALAQRPVPSAPASTERSSSAAAGSASSSSPAPIGIVLRPAIGGSVGVLPGAALGFGLAAAVTRGRWRLEAQAEGWLPRTADAPRAGTGGSVDLVGGGLRACFRPLDVSGEVSLCTGPSLGDEFAHGVGLRTTRDGGGLWGAWMLGLQGGFHVSSRLALRGSVEGGPRMVAPTFVSDSSGTLFEAAAWEGRAWLGLEIELR